MSNEIKVFKSEINGREVFLNLDTERFTWTQLPSSEAAAEIIAEWERVRIDLLWQELEQPRNKSCIKAFSTYKNGALCYFKRGVAMNTFGIVIENNQKQIAPYIYRHSLEKQVAMLRSIKPKNWQGLEGIIGVQATRAMFPVDLERFSNQ
jgi:hypothetical protein